jgi:hypothetical protein
MKTMLLAIAAIGEAATGLILLAYPPVVVRLLFGAEIAGAGLVMSRMAGIALMALGLACWPSKAPIRMARLGMATYSLLAAVYLLYLGIRGEWVGTLLWPAVVLHAVLGAVFGRAWLLSSKAGGRSNHASES